jgi:Zn-dependent M28 family amino/carboxypeptidase
MKMKLYVAALSVALAATAFGQAKLVPPAVPVIVGLPAQARAAANSIDSEKIRAHVRFLSHDLLEGRGPGVRGGDIAAEYIATQFMLSGLKPGGDNGTYFQPVSLYAVHTIEEKTHFSFIPKTGEPIALKYSADVVAKDQTGQAVEDIDAPIVFVGYGIDAPEYQWNDYAGVDVKGKVLLVVVNQPPSEDVNFFHGKTMTYYGRWTYKYEEAARRGAIGVLLIHRTDLASYGWEVVRNSQSVEKSYLEGDPSATLRAASWIQHSIADKLLSSIGMTADQAIEAASKRGFHAVELPVRLKAHVESAVRPYKSSNVIGYVAGQSEKPQAVFFTAHYDHLGIDPSLKGDNIYNGAADNATGCGILLEIARAYAESKLPPPHTVYFASVTAEEQGLLGSQYLGTHPPVPAKNISLDLNYDDLDPIGIPISAEVAGAERTSFYPTVVATARAFHLELQPDQFPKAGHFYRSDHFSMARVGVPAFSIGEGTLFEGHTPEWGKAQAEEYVKHHYHQPSDEYRADMDFRGDARMAQFGFVLGWQASALTKTVGWQVGDEFERPRKASEQ